MTQEENHTTQEEKENLMKKVLKMNDLEHTSNKLFTKFDELVSNQQVIMICIVTAMIGLIIFKYAFKNGNYTCENFVLNVYIYVLMGLLIVALTVVTILRMYPNSNLFSLYRFTDNSKIKLLFYAIIFIIIFGGLIYLLIINKYNILISHVLWLLIIVLFGIMLVPVYVSLKANNLFMKTVLTTSIVVVLLSLLIFYKKDLLEKYLSDDISNMILIACLIVIFAKICAYFILDFNVQEMKDMRLWVAYILVVAFTYILLNDTKNVINAEKDCVRALEQCSSGNNLDICYKSYPSYPLQSFEIFSDIIIMFQNFATIYSGGE